MNVLILSVSMGDGHFRAAEAIKESMEFKYKNSKTLIVDTFKYINPFINKLIVGGYINTLKASPQIYNKLYRMSESSSNIGKISKTINNLLAFRLKKLFKDFQPSIIVCTHPFPLQMVIGLLKKMGIAIPVIAVITDYVVHPFWILESIDAYVVANQYLKQDLIKMGVDNKVIYDCGIPVSRKFLQQTFRDKILKSLKLEDKPTILIMGGGLGIGEIERTFKELVQEERDFQIIVITGKNINLKKHILKYSINCNKKIRVFSYTDIVHELLSISDMIITKPGGMTISEALVKQVPIAIISPIPGQEEKNEHFLVNHGVAIKISKDNSIDSVLTLLFDNPFLLRSMKKASRTLAKPYSSEKVADLIHNLVVRYKYYDEVYRIRG